jgi:hypothetical protein
MHASQRHLWGLGFTFLFLAVSLRAETPSDPLNLVPDQADLIVKIENPRRLVDVVTNLEVLKPLRELQQFREFYDSTNTRRFYQLVAYFEKELGLAWPELLDRLASGGAVFAIKFGGDKPPFGFVIQGRDEALLRKFIGLASTVLDQELARQESKDHLEKSAHRHIEIVHIGHDFHAAVVGCSLIIANSADGLKHALDVHLDRKKNMTGVATVAEARQLLPAHPLAWMWLNMETVHKAPQAKDLFAQPRNDATVTVAYGGWLDVARRSSFLCAGLYQDKERIYTTIRMPRGRHGMPSELVTHIPPSDDAGSLPLLEPKGVIFSTSYYFDVGKLWEYRDKVFNKEIAKSFEDLDKNTALFLSPLGNKLGKLLTQAGTHHRFVVVNQPRPVDKQARLGFVTQFAFGLVLDMREPTFGEEINKLLRGAALLAPFRFPIKLTMVEEKHHDVTVIGYRFDDKDPSARINVNNSPLGILSTPSFALVGNYLVAASSLELCKELVNLIRQETESATPRNLTNSQTRVYADGGAQLLHLIEDQLFAQTILSQALDPKEAKEQVRKLIDWVNGLGMIEIDSTYADQSFHYDFIYAPPRSKDKTTGKTN